MSPTAARVPATARARAAAFCERYGLRVPVLLAPMAGSTPPALGVAVADAGGLAGFGALNSKPAAIAAWASEFRARSNGAFQINLWIPDPPPVRDAAREQATADFLGLARGGTRRCACHARSSSPPADRPPGQRTGRTGTGSRT